MINQILIGCYNWTHLKNVHQLSPQAILESHNLCSQKWSLKLFTESNFNKQANGFNSYKIVDKTSGGSEPESGLALQNIRKLSEFQTSFFWCEKLRQKGNPADFSFDSLRLFLLESDHFAQP